MYVHKNQQVSSRQSAQKGNCDSVKEQVFSGNIIFPPGHRWRFRDAECSVWFYSVSRPLRLKSRSTNVADRRLPFSTAVCSL